jgi:hypothetical protein
VEDGAEPAAAAGGNQTVIAMTSGPTLLQTGTDLMIGVERGDDGAVLRGRPGHAEVSVSDGQYLWISALVRNATLHFDLGSLAGLRLQSDFGLGLGLAFKPCGVFAAGLPFGLLCREALRGLADLR